MSWTRRDVLRAGGTAAVGAVVCAVAQRARAAASPAMAAAPSATRARRIELRNLHTAETLDLVYFSEGQYIPTALTAIQLLLRDFRNNQQHVIDPQLMDTLHEVARHVGVTPRFSVISGYRSPQTNEQLRERSDGVARHSLHLEGRAIDVRLAGVACADLATHALAVARGGVGYYRKSDFVHLDTGTYRTWKG